MRENTLNIRKHLLHLCKDNVPNIASEAARNLGISKQAAARHLQSLEKTGLVKSTGRGKAKTSRLVPILQLEWTFKRERLREDQVWRQNLSPHFKHLDENVRNIWEYGITEIVNNAIDHSEGSMVKIFLTGTALDSTVSIMDDGEGIFHRIQRLFALYNPREAILELVKGKLTTDAQNHTGQGIFFTSRAFDHFEINSHHLRFAHKRDPMDWLIEEKENIHVQGSTIVLNLDHDCIRALKSVFDEFAPPEEFDFSKTVVPLQLAQYEGEKLISRSQAKRLAARFEKFKTVVLDFAGVEEIGQGFADEIFRVFANAHPNVELIPIHVVDAVQHMISRALVCFKR